MKYEEMHCPRENLTMRLKTVNPVVLDILYKRGIKTNEEMEDFLFPSLSKSLKTTPSLIDTDKAVSRIKEAIRSHETVTIYHDYDADGITSGAIAKSALTNLGLEVNCYCNDREQDGFGICENGINLLMEQFPETKLIVTVDNGITGHAGVNRANELEVDIIITDHHEPDAVLPAALAVIDPKRVDEPDSQFKHSCGAMVIWRTLFQLYLQMGKSVDFMFELLDIAALGTVADVVPLVGQNRVVVQEGVKIMNEGRRPFFRAILEILELQSIDSQTIGYKIAPMINAVCRMGEDVGKVISLLLETDKRELEAGINELTNINADRKDETERETNLVIDQLHEEMNKKVIVFRDESLKEGIIGIVAGQLKQKYGLPAAVFAKAKDGNWKGSCRSVSAFHLKNALDQCSEFLLGYGGHAKAAGVTVKEEYFAAFQEKFEQLAQAASEEASFEEEEIIDVVLPSSEYTEQMVRELRVLEPFGEGFPVPLFGLVADIRGVRYMGTEEQHVKYQDVTGISVIQWGAGEKAKARVAPPRKFVGYPSLNHWRDTTSVQFIAR